MSKKLRFIFVASVVVAAIIMVLGSFVRSRSGEALSLQDIAGQLSKTNGLYGPLTHGHIQDFKKYIYKNENPAIAVIGSSRVLFFRPELFSAPFINLGGMGTMDDMISNAHEIFSAHTPAIVIFGIDFWWFDDIATSTPPSSKQNVSIASPYKWLTTGSMGLNDLADILFSRSPHVGARAIVHGDGFDLSGAYQEPSTYTGARPSDEEKFRDSLNQIQNNTGLFKKRHKISKNDWQRFDDFLTFLNDRKIKTILFLPPVAPSVSAAMQDTGQTAYINLLHEKLQHAADAHHMTLFNYHDAYKTSTTDCEFYDGIHAGETAAARILLHMALADEELRAVVDLPRTGWTIEHLGGRVSSSVQEIDFLNLNCDKKIATE